jgi:hypothetical protein
MTARFLTLRPSTPKAQRAKDLCKATTAEKRAARRLRNALDTASAANAARGPLKPEAASDAAARGLTQGGFSEWFSAHYAAARELLPEHELVTFHRLAREFYFGRLPRQAWDDVRRGFAAKEVTFHGQAREPYRPSRTWVPERPSGW